MGRGESRFIAIFFAVVVAIFLVLVPLFAAGHLGGKIFSLVLYAFLVFLGKDVITGKAWDNAHKDSKKEETKNGLKRSEGGWTKSDFIILFVLIFAVALAVVSVVNNVRYYNGYLP